MCRRLTISIIIPSAEAPEVFGEVLRTVFDNTAQPHEVILVDDGLDDTARQIAGRHPVTVVTNSGTGVSAARNTGAAHATGDLLLFIDTDVVLPRDCLERIHDLFQNPEIHGAVGIQSQNLRYTSFFSRYKNHWMRYTYRRLPDTIHLFYTSCAAIRRSVFMDAGGFDENYRAPSIEDTAFGSVLGRNSARIVVLKDLEFEHVKEYTLRSVLMTDFHRSAALVRYVLRGVRTTQMDAIANTSVPKRFMGSALAMLLGWIGTLVAPFIGAAMVWTLPMAALIVILLNLSWLYYLAREEGLGYAAVACLFLPLDVTFVVIGMLFGALSFGLGVTY